MTKESKCWVTAKVPFPTRVFKLSTVDQYVPKQWISRAFFFPLAANSTHEQVCGHLREGLSRTLTQLPILAGRIGRVCEGGQYAHIVVDKESEVYFGVRDHRGGHGHSLRDYARLREECFPMRDLASCASPEVLNLPPTEGSGVFTAQVNFVHGGLVLVFGISHLVGDAVAWATITRLWALHTKASSQEEEPNLEELRSDEARQQLSQGSTVQEEQDSSLWAVCDVADSSVNLPKLAVTRQTSFDVAQKPTLSSWRIWYFSPENLRQLKQDATPSTSWISTNDALFALFWHRSSVHRRLSSLGFETSSCRIPIDIRSRMQPRIPADFVGNAVSMLAVDSTISDLVRNDAIAPVSFLALKIRQAILSWEVSLFTSWIAEVNALPLDKALRHPSGSAVVPNILLNDHSKLDTCTLDWGVLGKIESIRGIDQNYPFPGLAVCMPFPMLVDGGIEVATVFDVHVNEALLDDELFMRYAKLRLG